MKLAATLLVALSALAQDLPEIRGSVTEYGSPAFVNGATVTLFEFVSPDGAVIRKQVASVFTNAQGAFAIKPTHAGRYYLEVSKPLYLSADEIEKLGWISGREMMETPLDLPGEPSSDLHFTLVRPGGITGRLIDENDKPVPNLTVIAMGLGPQARRDRAVTDKDGVFTFPAIIPTARVIRIGPANGEITQARSSFSKEDVAHIEQDFETTYWPGGASDPALALPLNMIPGVVANVGTIRLRKVPYYRAHLTYSGECGAKEGWIFTFAGSSGLGLAQCGKEALLNKLRPGTHRLAIWTGGAQPGAAATNWAVVPFSIDRENVEVPLSFQPVVNVPGKFVRPNASKLPDLSAARIALRSMIEVAPIGPGERDASVASQGDFTITNVAWPRHQVYFPTLDPAIAIKEIRYAGQPVSDGVITLVAGGALEIVIDDQPSSISGTAPPQSTIYVAKWPFASSLQRPFTFTAQADASGKFEIPSLTAGEYRAVAVRAALDAATLGYLLSAAPTITLNRGVQQNVELRLADATR